jgi:hypothetical protein
MSPSPTTLQWITAFVLLALFSWVLLSLFWDIIPAPWINPDKPQKRIFGIVLLTVMSLLSYPLVREVMVWVWMGIRHILGLDLEGV